jgi:mono/diheme cytochrome c family protein
MKETDHIRKFRWISFISGSILVILMVTAWVREGLLPDWQRAQSEYYHLTAEDTVPGSGPIASFRGIRQVSPEGLHRTDRCMTCHLGLENPAMAGEPQPHAMHPGSYLVQHPVDRFGCTVCHGGQGRAVDRISAFGEEASTHWDLPLLHPPYIESSCGKCHLGIFSDQKVLEGTGTFIHGKEIFQREGCLGCHQARGVGGFVGPDLTQQGEKSKHEYSFKNISGEQTISNWLKEHFQDPETVSPGSEMLKINLPEEELEALVTFTMGLAKPDFSYDYLGIEALQEFRGKRDALSAELTYAMICSACHGKSGEGKDYETYETGVPSLWNYDFIRVASPEMIKFTLLHGRGNRQMATWLPLYSGLTMDELDSLVYNLEDRFSVRVRFEDLNPLKGSVQRGRERYESDCLICHGKEGQGEIGLPLNNRDFLSAASDRYLFNTLVLGRNTAGMPAWSRYKEQDLADLISYVRTWGRGPRDDRSIDLPEGDPLQGDLQYHYLCSRCHGDFGEGNTGPAILTKDFQRLAGDRYLYETISGGRSHTAMFGWSTDVQGAGRLDRQGISDIIAYMRKFAGTGRDYVYPGSNPGNAGSGRELFSGFCADCHGPDGKGVKAPALNNQEFLSAASNGYIMATISLGREGTKMPSWGYGSDEYQALSASQRRDLVAWIRSWQRYRIRE